MIGKLRNTDRAVHNYLLSLWVGHSQVGREEGLLGFLRDEVCLLSDFVVCDLRMILSVNDASFFL